MKKSIAVFITVSCFFAATPTLAFDAENTVFEPPMIYSVYEKEGGVIPEGDVILNSQNVILSDSEGSQTPVISTEAVHNGEIPLARRSGTATKNGC